MMNSEANPFQLDSRWNAFDSRGFIGSAIIKIYAPPQKNDKVTDILLYKL